MRHGASKTKPNRASLIGQRRRGRSAAPPINLRLSSLLPLSSTHSRESIVGGTGTSTESEACSISAPPLLSSQERDSPCVVAGADEDFR
jgi:hypothetical protein